MESASCGAKRKIIAESHRIVPEKKVEEMMLCWRSLRTEVCSRFSIAWLSVEKHCDGEERDARKPAAVAQSGKRIAADFH